MFLCLTPCLKDDPKKKEAARAAKQNADNSKDSLGSSNTIDSIIVKPQPIYYLKFQ